MFLFCLDLIFLLFFFFIFSILTYCFYVFSTLNARRYTYYLYSPCIISVFVTAGFFWTNMARRFRLALRPDKRKSRDGSSSPTDTVVKQCYDNIQSRQPIRDAVATPVSARPSLETIRLAYGEAKKALVDMKNASDIANNSDDDTSTKL